jgi:uncharacterized protein (TIGR02448 family)
MVDRPPWALSDREFNQIMATRQNKRWIMAFGRYWLAALALVASSNVRSELLSSNGHPDFSPSSTTGYGLLITTVMPFITTTDDFKALSKQYIQAVRDDAAAFVATDGDFDGSMLESAWRAHLEQHADLQSGKKEFAHMVLGTHG